MHILVRPVETPRTPPLFPDRVNAWCSCSQSRSSFAQTARSRRLELYTRMPKTNYDCKTKTATKVLADLCGLPRFCRRRYAVVDKHRSVAGSAVILRFPAVDVTFVSALHVQLRCGSGDGAAVVAAHGMAICKPAKVVPADGLWSPPARSTAVQIPGCWL
jgi:hypothetical protein